MGDSGIVTPFTLAIEAKDKALVDKSNEACDILFNNTSFGINALIITVCILSVILMIWYYETIKGPTGKYVSSKTGVGYTVSHSVLSGIVTIKKTATGDDFYSGHLSLGSSRLQVRDCEGLERVGFVTENHIYWPKMGEYQGTTWKRISKNPAVFN